MARVGGPALLAGLLIVLLSGQPASQVSGWLSINDVRTPLQFVYASAQPGFFDASKEDIRILLSDVPLSDEERADAFALIRLGRQGTAHIVEVVLDADGTPISGAIYAPIFNGMLSATGMHEFLPVRFERSMVAGRLRTDGARDINSVRWEYDARFSAPITRPPTREQIAAAVAGPAGQAASAYIAAVLEGDADVLRRLLTRGASSRIAGQDGTADIARRRTDLAPNSAVVNVNTMQDERATAVVQGHINGLAIESELPLVLEDGRWKIDR